MNALAIESVDPDMVCPACGTECPPLAIRSRLMRGPCPACARRHEEERQRQESAMATALRARCMARVGVPGAYQEARMDAAAPWGLEIIRAFRRSRPDGSMVVVEGPPRSGKTFLLSAHAFWLAGQNQMPRYLSVGELDRLLGMNHGSEPYQTALDMADMAALIPVLVLDDLGIPVSNATRRHLERIIQTRYLEHRTLIVSTHLSQAEFFSSGPHHLQAMFERRGEWHCLANR